MTLDIRYRTVALIPAYNNAETIARTVSALILSDAFDEVIVIDDASQDRTADAALSAGARVVRHPENRGKGAALQTGVDAAPDAELFVFVDADTGQSAKEVVKLIDPILVGDSDMTIAVLPDAGKRGGFGFVSKLARRGIFRMTGMHMRAPLSGQRALRADLARSLVFAPRFGAEVGMTIDAFDGGAHVREISVPIEHDHRGRRLRGFMHRARQGIDVSRALWPRVTSKSFRMMVISAVSIFILLTMVLGGLISRPSNEPRRGSVDHVVLFGMPTLELSDLERPDLPNLQSLISHGAIAATSIRTVNGNPIIEEGYESISAGGRVPAQAQQAEGFNSGEIFNGATAGDALAVATGKRHSGAVVVPNITALRNGADSAAAASSPGVLGTGAHNQGYRTMVIGNSDFYDPTGRPVVNRAIATSVMDENGSVDYGDVSQNLLERRVGAPFNLQAANGKIADIYSENAEKAQITAIDSGDLLRAYEMSGSVSKDVATRMRVSALRRTDALLGQILQRMPAKTMVIVAAVVPNNNKARLTPMVISTPDTFTGRIYSPSTQTQSLVTLTDLTPTIMDALSITIPDGMPGAVLAMQPGSQNLSSVKTLDRLAQYRDALYGATTRFLIFLLFVFLFCTAYAMLRPINSRRLRKSLTYLGIVMAAFPFVTFLLRVVPFSSDLGLSNYTLLLLTLTIGGAYILWLATRNGLSALRIICGLTVAAFLIDIATGGQMQLGGVLSNSPYDGGRFHGFGNLAFAVLASSAIIWGMMHYQLATRKREALLTVAWMFLIVIVADGAPMLGADVGGLITLAPLFVLMIWYLSGKRLSARAVVTTAIISIALVGGALLIDLARPATSQSHFAKFFTSLVDHSSTAEQTIVRKVRHNVHSYTSTWIWVIPIVGSFCLAMFTWSRKLAQTVKSSRAYRAAIAGLLFTALVGYAVNDSGIGVAAFVFYYLSMFTAQLALREENQELVFLRDRVLRSVPKQQLAAEEVLL
jgi:hypothetical protein